MAIDRAQSGIYFAKEPDPDKLGDLIMQRQRAWQTHMRASGRLRQIRDSHSMRYGFDRDFMGSNTRRVTRKKKGEILDIRTNNLASIERGIVTLVTAQRPSFEPHAINTDADTQSEASLAKNVLEDCLQRKKLEEHLENWVRHAVRYSAGWLEVLWDPERGSEAGANPDGSIPPGLLKLHPQTGFPVGIAKEGDVAFHNYTPLDVAFDYRGENSKTIWLNARKLRNRYDLADDSRYGKFADHILSIDTDSEFIEFRLSIERRTQDLDTSLGTDLIPVYDFWHERTPALPDGMHCTLLSDGTVIYGPEPLPYDEVPIYRLTQEDYDDTPHGNTVMFDLQGLQQAQDAAISYGLTRQQASLPKMLLPEQANVQPSDLNVSMAVLKYRGTQPPTEFKTDGNSAPDLNMAQFIQKSMETISGVNSVMRGNPEDALKDGSGAALALIQAQAILNNTSLQANYDRGLGRVGTGIIRCFQKFAQFSRRLEAIAGQSQAHAIRAFVGDDLKGIGRVSVKRGSPLLQTTAGRMQLVQAFMKMGLKVDPERLVSFVETGKWEVIAEDPSQEDMFIRKENEALRLGQGVPAALWTENPARHVLGHMMGVLNSIEAKSNPQVLNNTLNHIQTHVDAWKGADIGALTLLGFPLPPPPPMPPGMLPPGMPPPGLPPPGPAPMGAHPPAPPHGPPTGHVRANIQPSGPMQPVGAPPNMPKLPEMPNGQPAMIPGVTG